MVLHHQSRPGLKGCGANEGRAILRSPLSPVQTCWECFGQADTRTVRSDAFLPIELEVGTGASGQNLQELLAAKLRNKEAKHACCSYNKNNPEEPLAGKKLCEFETRLVTGSSGMLVQLTRDEVGEVGLTTSTTPLILNTTTCHRCG